VKIAIIAAEIAPWAKVGGLADVIGALPAAFRVAGAEPFVIVPGYKAILDAIHAKPVAQSLSITIDGVPEEFSILQASDARGVPMQLIAHDGYFGRDGIYGPDSRDYPDNLRRFIFFSRAASHAAAVLQPDIVHAHDWHAAAAPIVMRADPALAAQFKRTLSVFTIHNLAFQGIATRDDFDLLGIAPSYFSIGGVEFYGQTNLLKGAIRIADGVTTVSPTYAREVTTNPELGFGLEGVLGEKHGGFVGILNGADYHEWDPAHDELIASKYSPGHPEGKLLCKRALLDAAGLPYREGVPLVGMVSRMTSQKGFDLLHDALDDVMRLELQLVILASGDPLMEKYFQGAEDKYRGQLRVMLEFNNASAHRVQAGSDAFLMPSRFEPCGLTQMYALRYGNAPIVRATGGLRDTVSEFNPRAGTGNGFVFEQYNAPEMVAALTQMIKVYRDPTAWRRLMTNAFAADFSWERAAKSYLDWFEKLRRELAIG
jgi:starch synthase